jgi:hypothetical protein
LPDGQALRIADLDIHSVHFVATVNDPENRLAALTWQYLPTMLLLYHGISLLCSQATSPRVMELLRELGATAVGDEDEPVEVAQVAARLAGERG